MLINKDNLPLVAMDFMNETHLEDVEIINEVYKAIVKFEKSQNNFNDLCELYEKWYIHTVEHFKVEEEKMASMNFPPYMFHKGEHDRCLEIMQGVLIQFKNTKNISIMKEYFEVDLLTWLINHIQTMDTVTAMFFKTGQSPCQSRG